MPAQPSCNDRPDLYRRLDLWLGRSPGRELMELEVARIEALLEEVFGYYLIQVGWSANYFDALDRSRIHRHLALEAAVPVGYRGRVILGDPLAMPIRNESVDAVFLPHSLDFCQDPRALIAEAERILIPEGRILLLGLNPWSLWGLVAVLRRRSGEVPWCGSFLPPRRVGTWLQEQGFEIEVREFIQWRPPLPHAGLLRRLEFLESLGHGPWSPLAGVYLLRAVKRVSAPTLVGPLWSKGRALLPKGQAEPTVRGIHER